MHHENECPGYPVLCDKCNREDIPRGRVKDLNKRTLCAVRATSQILSHCLEIDWIKKQLIKCLNAILKNKTMLQESLTI